MITIINTLMRKKQWVFANPNGSIIFTLQRIKLHLLTYLETKNSRFPYEAKIHMRGLLIKSESFLNIHRYYPKRN